MDQQRYRSFWLLSCRFLFFSFSDSKSFCFHCTHLGQVQLLLLFTRHFTSIIHCLSRNYMDLLLSGDSIYGWTVVAPIPSPKISSWIGLHKCCFQSRPIAAPSGCLDGELKAADSSTTSPFLWSAQASWRTRTIWASTCVLLARGYGGVGLCGRKGIEQLPLFKRVCGVPALSAWCGRPLPHVGGVQHSSKATATGPTSHQDLQAVGSNVAKRSGLGPGDGLIASMGCVWTLGSIPFAGVSFIFFRDGLKARIGFLARYLSFLEANHSYFFNVSNEILIDLVWIWMATKNENISRDDNLVESAASAWFPERERNGWFWTISSLSWRVYDVVLDPNSCDPHRWVLASHLFQVRSPSRALEDV